MTRVVVTVAFGKFTHTISVSNWESALACIASWSHLDSADWIRVQAIPEF